MSHRASRIQMVYLMHERDLQAHFYAATCMYREDVKLNGCLQCHYNRSHDYPKRHLSAVAYTTNLTDVTSSENGTTATTCVIPASQLPTLMNGTDLSNITSISNCTDLTNLMNLSDFTDAPDLST